LLNSKLKDFNSKELITDEILNNIFNPSSPTLLNKNQPENQSEKYILISPSKLELNEANNMKSPKEK
jgi:hypothetical protein